jgi:phenylpropionate dioxygenase-like ring-hydroxylating dioxygenase large terminal subunit
MNIFFIINLLVNLSFVISFNSIILNTKVNIITLKNKLLQNINIEKNIDKIDKIDNIENIDKIIENKKNLNFYNFGNNPQLINPNENGELTWYPIGIKNMFNSKKPVKITVRDVNYVAWKDENNKYYCLRNACSHQGASLAQGIVNNNCISCPYHGYIFDGKNGKLNSIPFYETKENDLYNMNSYKIIEKNDIVYLNTVPIRNTTVFNQIDETKIWEAPEESDPNFKRILLSQDFENNAKLLSINSLDVCHISFVHTFGNKKSPNPINKLIIQKVNDAKYHFKILYEYLSGKDSIVKKIFKFKNLIVENEFILPHTTVARVKFGNYVSTVITCAQPISKFKSKLFVKTYRNYWYINEKKNNIFFLPYYKLINYIGNYITEDLMRKTLNEDKRIIDNIDKYDYDSMHGKFSIKFDKLSNLYKHYYVKFYEKNKKDMGYENKN